MEQLFQFNEHPISMDELDFFEYVQSKIQTNKSCLRDKATKDELINILTEINLAEIEKALKIYRAEAPNPKQISSFCPLPEAKLSFLRTSQQRLRSGQIIEDVQMKNGLVMLLQQTDFEEIRAAVTMYRNLPRQIGARIREMDNKIERNDEEGIER